MQPEPRSKEKAMFEWFKNLFGAALREQVKDRDERIEYLEDQIRKHQENYDSAQAEIASLHDQLVVANRPKR
jgi:hypothetical protein